MPRPPSLASAVAVQNAFYAALAHADVNSVMALWADDEEVVCVHPGGQRLLGLHAIRRSFDAILANGPIRVEINELQTFESASLSVHHLIERITVTDNDNSHHVYIPTTNVYIKSGAGWQLLIHHASPGRSAPSGDLPTRSRGSGRPDTGTLH